MRKRGKPKQGRLQRPFPSKVAKTVGQQSGSASPPPSAAKNWLLLVLFWGYVLVPLAWGVASTAQKAWLLFK